MKELEMMEALSDELVKWGYQRSFEIVMADDDFTLFWCRAEKEFGNTLVRRVNNRKVDYIGFGHGVTFTVRRASAMPEIKSGNDDAKD